MRRTRFAVGPADGEGPSVSSTATVARICQDGNARFLTRCPAIAMRRRCVSKCSFVIGWIGAVEAEADD
jgi:hypothetical protein